jgi:HD-GYP domain-containing protein (c-di-GMP phosphodiesterase class II)
MKLPGLPGRYTRSEIRQIPKILPLSAPNRRFQVESDAVCESDKMRRIIVKEARPGMIAARSVVDPNATPMAGETPATLAATGKVLTLDHLIRFHEAGVYELWVDDPGLEFLDTLCGAQTTAAQRRLADALQDAFLRLSSWVAPEVWRRHEDFLRRTLHAVLYAAAVIPYFPALTENEALLQHSCEVLAVSTLLGMQLEDYLVAQRRRLNGRQAGDVVNLALGALFHDVGELAVPAEARESRAPVAEMMPEDSIRHVAEGYAMVHGRLDPSAASVVLHHHQHFDGSGFGGLNEPGGAAVRSLAGGEIHVFARIVMVADWFCRSAFANGARLPQPLVRTLWDMQQMPQRQAFDPVVLRALMAVFPPFAEGEIVTLDDGRQALVTRADGTYPCYPEVHVLHDAAEPHGDEPLTMDLAERLDVGIQAVDNTSVEGFLFGERKVRPLIAA